MSQHNQGSSGQSLSAIILKKAAAFGLVVALNAASTKAKVADDFDDTTMNHCTSSKRDNGKILNDLSRRMSLKQSTIRVHCCAASSRFERQDAIKYNAMLLQQ
jgi:4-hydroxy-3-methylbut-2-enyl diphosphate reductase IspH